MFKVIAYAPPTPTSIASCSVWLKADALSLSNNDPVSLWSDSSGNNNHVTQSNASYNPIYKTNILNGKPAVFFDGSDDLLTSINNSIPIATTFAVFNEKRGYSTFQDWYGAVMLKGGSAGQQIFQGYAGSANIFRYYMQAHYIDNKAVNDSGFSPFGTYHIVCSTTIYGDRNLSGSLLIGDDTDTTGRHWSGSFAEVIGYSRELTPTERGLVMDYLNTKYAIY